MYNQLFTINLYMDSNLKKLFKLNYSFSKKQAEQFGRLLLDLEELPVDVDALDFYLNDLFCLSQEKLEQLVLTLPKHIQYLSLRNNHLGIKLLPFISQLPESVTHLDIAHNQLIQLSVDDYTQLIQNIPRHITSLGMDEQDIRLAFPFFNEHIETLYLTGMYQLKNYSQKRSKLLSKIPSTVLSIYLDDDLWILQPQYVLDFNMIPSHVKHLYTSFESKHFAEILEMIQTIPTHVEQLSLDLSQELWLEFHQYSNDEKIQYFLSFPETIQTIIINDCTIYPRQELINMQQKKSQIPSRMPFSLSSIFSFQASLQTDAGSNLKP
jgi:hypothetical protein